MAVNFFFKYNFISLISQNKIIFYTDLRNENNIF